MFWEEFQFYDPFFFNILLIYNWEILYFSFSNTLNREPKKFAFDINICYIHLPIEKNIFICLHSIIIYVSNTRSCFQNSLIIFRLFNKKYVIISTVKIKNDEKKIPFALYNMKNLSVVALYINYFVYKRYLILILKSNTNQKIH